MKKRLRKVTKILLFVLLILLGGFLGLQAYWSHEDAKHDRFFRTGQSINEFLSEYGHSLKDASSHNNVDLVLQHYAGNYGSPGRGRWVLERSSGGCDVAVYELSVQGNQTFQRDELRDELTAYLAGLTAVDDVKFKIDLIEEVEPERSAVLTVKFILDGVDPQGVCFQDRYFFRWRLVNEAANGAMSWRIVRDELVEGIRVAGRREGFRELDDKLAGINYRHTRDPRLDPNTVPLKFGVIEHAGSGVSTVDYDNDGRPDLFFADGVRSRLFRNVTEKPGEPKFIDVTDEAGLGGLDHAISGIFADLDNDGFKDLVVIRYCAPSKVFHNNGNGRFTDVTKEMGFDLDGPAMSACFLDYDRDGFVDLYVGIYGNAFEEVPNIPFFAKKRGKNRLFRNVGGRRFEEVPDAGGAADNGWTMAVAAGDMDGDGWPDLVMANDFGKKSLYHNNGDGTFTEVTKHAGVLDFSGGMGVAIADFDDDGRLDLYFANINSNQRWFGEEMTINQYMRNVARTRWLFKDLDEYSKLHDLLGSNWRELGKQIGKGNSLFSNNGDGTFTEVKDSHAVRAGWGWGVAFFDMGNAGRLDIFAANGWISNTSKDDL